jgi:hypothetical protein
VRHDPHLASHGVSDAREINGLPRLGVRDAPNLEAIPVMRAEYGYRIAGNSTNCPVPLIV